ncbi:YggS family pyridoxal phosphate-dependent enzyme [Corynebacterium casei]|uniref:YggS family pyridoxal phosphate-dependent enzyme n=1 Tax=Corynebacterium casei TaxID=160386 RepID=UPI003F930458
MTASSGDIRSAEDHSNSRREELAAGLTSTRELIEQLAKDSGRQDVPELLPVTKFHPAADIALLAELGIKDVAENREQEARGKAEELPDVHFHMIGQVQTKKANHVARWAHSVHSVDTEKLANALNRGVDNAGRESLPVFIQVSYDGDTARGGVALDGVEELAKIIEDLPNLELRGLMVVPPLDTVAKEVFSAVRELADSLGEQLKRPMKLSAGMSADLKEAIAAGTDIVRVGTGIMGARPLG